MDEKLLEFAVKAIIAHLHANPASADTAEGIHQWWIHWPTFPESIEVTFAALEQLEQSGFIEHLKVGNREIWRRPRTSEVVSAD